MTSNYTGRRIRERMDELHMSYLELERITGYSRSTLNRYCTGESRIPISRIPNIANALNVTSEYLLGINRIARETSNDVAEFDIVASVKCGYGSSVVEEYSGDSIKILKEELRFPSEECFVMRAFGDSMSPFVCHGDLLVIHKQEECQTGDIALVSVNDEFTLKKINRNGDSLELIPFNEDFPSIVYRGRSLAQVRICGKLTKLIRDCL